MQIDVESELKKSMPYCLVLKDKLIYKLKSFILPLKTKTILNNFSSLS